MSRLLFSLAFTAATALARKAAPLRNALKAAAIIPKIPKIPLRANLRSTTQAPRFFGTHNTVDGNKPFSSFTQRGKASSFETGKWEAPKIVRDREHDRQNGVKRLFSTTSYSIEDGSLFSLIFMMVHD